MVMSVGDGEPAQVTNDVSVAGGEQYGRAAHTDGTSVDGAASVGGVAGWWRERRHLGGMTAPVRRCRHSGDVPFLSAVAPGTIGQL